MKTAPPLLQAVMHRALIWIGITCLLIGRSAQAQVYERIFSFTDARALGVTGGAPKGAAPTAALVEDNDGNLYGTTSAGGAYTNGTIFRMTHSGVLSTLVEFDFTTGANPNGLVRASDGNFYGTTQQGGTNGLGTVFKMTPSGVLTILVNFTGTAGTKKGSNPYSELTEGSDGNFYGTTSNGGANNLGTIFKVTTDGTTGGTTLVTLVEFTGTTGANKGSAPRAALFQASDGSFYGTTLQGGANNLGSAFKMVTSGTQAGTTLTTLVEFTGTGGSKKGGAPSAALIQGGNGSFYGTTQQGGANNLGTVFKMATNGTQVGTTLTTLVEFTGTSGSSKGSVPYSALLQASDGSFYGMTNQGGAYGIGTAFKIVTDGTPAGTTLTTLVEFTGNSGNNKGTHPWAAFIQASDGNLYGTAYTGGARGWGTVFRMTSGGALTTLVEFAFSNGGSFADAGLVQGNDGAFYGATVYGGSNGLGMIFKITGAGMLTSLVDLSDSGNGRGTHPYAALLKGSDGNFYGTTVDGGTNGFGTVFKMTSAGVLTTLVDFTGTGGSSKGSNPYAGLIQGSDGNFYGTTQLGGVSNLGTVFKMVTNGTPLGTTLTALVEFTGTSGSSKGSNPYAGLIQGSDGNFYGTTQLGGVSNLGTLFKMVTNGTPLGTTLTALVEFTGTSGSKKGSNPYAALVQGSDGNFYGTTADGGVNTGGTVFMATPLGALTTLVEFAVATGGYHPHAALIQGTGGIFYGTTYHGAGISYNGTVFKIVTNGTQLGTTLTTLANFRDPDRQPQAPLIRALDGSLYGTVEGPNGAIYRLVFPGPPLVFIRDPQVLGSLSALLQASINPAGSATSVTLKYGTDGINFPYSVSILSNLLDNQTNVVGTTLTNLTEGTTYFYQFMATNSAGTTSGPVQSFLTLAAPETIAQPPSNILSTSATFNGTVNARTNDSSVSFQYDSDVNFTNQVTVSAVPGTVTGNATVAVSAAVAGLTKGTTYYYRIIATNVGGTTVSGVQSFTTLTDPVATVGGASAVTFNSAQVNGTVNAMGADTTVYFEYGTNGVNFPNSVSAVPANITAGTGGAVPVSAVLSSGLSQGTTYYYRVRATSAGGTGVSGVASFSLDILSGFTQLPPSAPPDASGFILVNTTPNGIGGWRFAGEQLWRTPGTVVGGLTTGDRQVEFKPVPGYYPPATDIVSVISGGAATVYQGDYATAGGNATGAVFIQLKPDSLTAGTLPTVQRAQWRFLGEDDAQWRESGTAVGALVAGSYLIESKPLAGRTTPAVLSMTVGDGQTVTGVATYYLADPVTGTQPSIVPFETVTGSTNMPYQYVGQLRTSSGAGTGFVVKARVVATAAHVVFDDGTLSAATNAQWVFERDRASFEPVPMTPRGFYMFSGYSAQRAAENTPGTSAPASQTLDAAAVYFLQDAGRGGYGGYLASDSTPNEWVTSSALKMLVGYPVNGISASNQGRMYATAPANVPFAFSYGRTYTTSAISSVGGNSGGPLCVQFQNGSYYPAAIYLGGTGQTVVRVIDSDVVDMFSRAEVSGNGGADNTGGGITIASFGVGNTNGNGLVSMNMTRPAGASGEFTWGVSPSAFTGTRVQKKPYGVGQYLCLYFKPFAGYLTPTGNGPSGGVPVVADANGNPLPISANTQYNVTVAYLYVQNINFGPPATRTLADQPLALSASVNSPAAPFPYTSGYAVTFRIVSGPATLNGNTLTPTGVGTVVIEANQAGDGITYGAASPVTASITITADNVNAWNARNFTVAELGNSAISGPLADPNKNGVGNLLEFAFNMNPKAGGLQRLGHLTGNTGLPYVSRDGSGHLVMEYLRRKASGNPGISYAVEFADSPGGLWTVQPAESATSMDTTFERVTVADPAISNQRYGRVRVSSP